MSEGQKPRETLGFLGSKLVAELAFEPRILRPRDYESEGLKFSQFRAKPGGSLGKMQGPCFEKTEWHFTIG